MLLHCHGKKCNTTREHKLKVDTDEALCMECGDANPLVSAFMKNAMKTAGDLYRSVTKKQAFTYKCIKCELDRGVKLIDEQAVCETCSHPLNLSAPMIEAIRTMNPKATENTVVEPKAELNKGVVKRKKSA